MRFRKRPVVIDAFQYTERHARNGISEEECPDWLEAAYDAGIATNQVENSTVPRAEWRCYLQIQTLEGDHRADPEDWIIRGVKGELYPIKPDIFAMTYDPVEEG